MATPVERALARALEDKTAEVEQLRDQVATLRFQLRIVATLPPTTTRPIYVPRPRSPEDDHAPRRRHPDLRRAHRGERP